VVTRYAYDGPNLIAEYNGSNTLIRRYVHGPGSVVPLVQYMDSGTTPEYLLADHQGSIIAATGSTGTIATQTVGATTVRKILTYGEYGQPARGQGDAELPAGRHAQGPDARRARPA